MTWTQPKTWTSEPLTSSDLNTHLRDNLEALKDPPSQEYTLNQATDYTTTSAVFVNVDNTNLAFTLTTNGGDVMVHVHIPTSGSGGIAYFDLEVDGTRLAGDDGLARVAAGGVSIVSFTRLISGLAVTLSNCSGRWGLAQARFSQGQVRLVMIYTVKCGYGR